MKKNIIFALFTAFMLIAIAAGFYMQWNPTAIAILLGMLFVGTICYLIGICRHLIMSSVDSWKEKIHKAYRKYIRRIAVNCVSKVIQAGLNKIHISFLCLTLVGKMCLAYVIFWTVYKSRFIYFVVTKSMALPETTEKMKVF